MERGIKSKNVPEGTDTHLIPPEGLYSTQKWFAQVITQPLSHHHKLPPLAPSLYPIAEEAKQIIAPSSTLAPHKRIEIYYQQYWWRLLKVLHDNFPMLTKILGFTSFNQTVGIPYLVDHPPSDWALCKLGNSLPSWMSTHYKGKKKKLCTQAATIDWAAQKAFWTKHYPPNIHLETILDTNIKLQPHITLFTFSIDLLSYRDHLLANNESFFAFKKGHYHVAIFRDLNNHVVWQPLKETENMILCSLSQGMTINVTLNNLAHEGSELYEEARTLLPLFFRRWISLGWFYVPC
ncbi:MAG: putative DNA-binding domain-containing protein [Chlamydiia bacterium]|nr:putative DNA-binding domain-containing protein [Chlamydiia bacterium]